ncbi:hypothetical protein RIF29_31418 [Crotalaria pallida]|uniref:Uncharacterized protein n=1 Tax=Crotalaria pallida TaxID=3830 RepID=A0AAN9EJD9_CROPI
MEGSKNSAERDGKTIYKDSWTEEEERILIEAHKHVGNRWKKISKRLPGRTENMVKNHFHSTKRLKIVKMQKNKHTNSKGTLLQKYIMEITTPKKEMKKSMSKINLRRRDHSVQRRLSDMSTQIYGQENAEVNWNLRSNVPHISSNGVYLPMIVGADEIASGPVMDDNTMQYEDVIDIDNLMSENLMKMEVEMMEMIMGKP